MPTIAFANAVRIEPPPSWGSFPPPASTNAPAELIGSSCSALILVDQCRLLAQQRPPAWRDIFQKLAPPPAWVWFRSSAGLPANAPRGSRKACVNKFSAVDSG